MAPVPPRQSPVRPDDHEVHHGGPGVALEHRDDALHIVGGREEHVVVERDDEVALGGGHAGVPTGRAAIVGQADEPHVGKVAPDHLGAAVGGGVVHRDDLEGSALATRRLQRASQHVAPLVVEDRDRDGGAQFGTWRRISGPITLAIGTGSRFHASMRRW